MFDEDGARFSPQSTRNKSCCSVHGCRSKASRDLTVRFHSFPKPGIDFINATDEFGVNVKMCRREAWERSLMMNKKITENTRICSLHFQRHDYILPDAPTQKRYLKRDAVPTCNLSMVKGDTLPNGMRKNKVNQRKDFMARSADNEDYNFVEIKSEVLESEIKHETLDLEAIIEQDHSYTMPRYMDQRVYKDGFTIKEEPEEPEVKLESSDMDDEYEYECLDESLTDQGMNIDSLAIKEESDESEIKCESVDLPDIDLNDHFQQIWEPPTDFEGNKTMERTKTYHEKSIQTDSDTSNSKFVDILKNDRDLNVMTGIRNFDILNKIIELFKIASPHYAKAVGLKLTINDRIIMTFMKLKQSLSYGVLAIFFKCSSKIICKKIVLKTLDILSNCLKFSIRWPDQGENPRYIPDDFHQFPNVRFIVSRTEIAIRRSNNLSRRIATRSCYKRYYSVKFLTVVNPDGTICYVSKACGGRDTHRSIFAQSNIIGLLRKNDVLMILKEFPIEDICRKKNVKLVRSLYSQNKESSSNPNNYRVRLNVNRKIFRFKIFRRKLTSSLALKAEQIVTIICATENLHKSMLASARISIT